MGGGAYFNDVREAQQATRTVRSSEAAFDYSRKAFLGQVHSVHPDLNILDRIRECVASLEHPDPTAIVVGMDVTASRGKDAKAIYAEVPKLLGVIQSSGFVPDPQIMWAAIGDANSDKAPLQVGQFESDRRIDAQLSQIWMEEGGGGTGEESYELLAYFLANRTKLDAIKNGKRGFVFFTGDEAPYATVSAAQVRNLIDRECQTDIPTEKVFRQLQKKFDPYLIYPRSSMEARSRSIDQEIRKRLQEAGGRFKDVNIRASLIWNDRNDLDLHCLTPGKEHIFYGMKQAYCMGELDVDRNVQGETTKPVENIRWAKGTAAPGRYVFWVENFRYHESSRTPVKFKVELDIDGKIQTYEGEIRPGMTHSESKQVAFEFVYDPAAGKASAPVDERAAYQDTVVLEKWGRLIPETQILRVEDPASAVDVMLGVLALKRGGMDLAQYETSMKERKVTKARREDVLSALKDFALRGAVQEVPADLFD